MVGFLYSLQTRTAPVRIDVHCCFNSLSAVCDRIPCKKQLQGERACLGSQLKVQRIMMWMSRQQELKQLGVPASRKCQQAMPSPTSVFSFLCSPGHKGRDWYHSLKSASSHPNSPSQYNHSLVCSDNSSGMPKSLFLRGFHILSQSASYTVSY